MVLFELLRPQETRSRRKRSQIRGTEGTAFDAMIDLDI